MEISKSILYVGVDDHELDLFEGQFIIPEGVSYNSYIIEDEKITVMDTVDDNATDEWLVNVENVLKGRKPYYLVLSHVEPDHSASIGAFIEKYPDTIIVGNTNTFKFVSQFYGGEFEIPEEKKLVVKEKDTLELGTHKLTFMMATMVHWPEVMVSFEETDKVLFAADGFGKFGAIDTYDGDWACEARRYYFNIVGKYGMNVQMLLKKVAEYDIQTICPLHGPVLNENLGYYLNLYDTWSKYEPENEGILIAYATMHGNTKKAAEKLAEIIKSKSDVKVVVSDVARDDLAEVIEDAFRYDRMVVCAPTYNTGLNPKMEDLLRHLAGYAYQNRKVGIIENGTWAPQAGNKMKEIIKTMKDIKLLEPMVTIKSSLKEENMEALNALADALLR